MKNNPELCKASDYCAINCHAFFDGKVTADKAGPFVANWAKMVSDAAGGKTTVITETGWPSQGYVPLRNLSSNTVLMSALVKQMALPSPARSTRKLPLRASSRPSRRMPSYTHHSTTCGRRTAEAPLVLSSIGASWEMPPVGDLHALPLASVLGLPAFSICPGRSSSKDRIRPA